MGLFDKASKKKDRINRVEICFNSKLPPSFPEPRAVEELVRFFNLAESFTPDVYLSTAYGSVPGVTESLNRGDCTEELTGFVVARAIMLGIDKKEWEKIIRCPFNIAGTLGVLIAGYVKESSAKSSE